MFNLPLMPEPLALLIFCFSFSYLFTWGKSDDMDGHLRDAALWKSPRSHRAGISFGPRRHEHSGALVSAVWALFRWYVPT